jgi:hypothetical protein
MMTLKLHNIYALPDGHELVARRGAYGEYGLHDPRKGAAAPPVYIIGLSGKLLSWIRPTTWTAADLRDTGKALVPVIESLVML